ncbi:MAG: cyclodeaminase/cyclohydrolase family protein [Planctomycetes bacterium]|nr:cyclodeaminase/cyclohydrolase family protein [Planctomycetota bacterium]
MDAAAGRLRDRTLAELTVSFAARTPAPGGGAAAAVAAAIGAAIGAMSARYTTGAKWGALSAQAEALARSLDDAAGGLLALAEADADAYAAVVNARKIGGDVAAAEARAAAIPADILAACALQAAAMRGFLPLANPQLVSDVRVSIHLLAGAGRAAWQTLLVNHPSAQVLAVARAHVRALDEADVAAIGTDAAPAAAR